MKTRVVFALALSTLIVFAFLLPVKISAQSSCKGDGGLCVSTRTPSDCCPGLSCQGLLGLNAGTCQKVSSTTCDSGKGINTAIGCVHFDSSSNLVSFILRWAIGVGGGIAFLLILYAGFQIMTSAGDPQRLKAGQELLTAAISGIIMLIFSVFILRVIGVNILGIF